jgi:hypothetical protein
LLKFELLETRIAPATFNVNSTADILNPPAGVVTLRSAIQAANTNADATNTINLTVAGTYAITLPGTPGEVDNAAGEFAIFSTNLTTGTAKTNLNMVNTSGGNVTVDGGHLSRVFDVNPSLQIGAVNITAGGSGFDTTSGIAFSAPTLAGGIQATGTLVVSGGAVLGVTITNPGTGYTVSAPPTISFTGPGMNAAGNIVLSSPSIAVSLQGFTIQNGLAQPGDLAAGTGGGIRIVGNAVPTLTNMVVTNNSASADGGGIAMENSSAGTDFLGGGTRWLLTINNSTISNNHAGDAGGGVDTDGSGSVDINAGTVISGNTDINQGAGVYLDGIGNAVTGVMVTAGGSGYTSAPLVNFGGPGTGAAGFATIAGGTVTGVTITNSGTGYTTAPTVTFVGGGGTGATAFATVVANLSADLTMTGTLVNGNSALGNVNGLGGGISNAGNSAVSIFNSTLENNFAATTGGGFSDENNGLGTLVVENSVFLNNSAVGNGGAIFVSGPSALLANTEVKGNSTNASGGGLFDSGTTLILQRNTFSGNTASINGGAIEIETTGSGGSLSTITNNTITGNQALNNGGGDNGGGIDAPATTFTGELSLINDTINANFADNGGGAFWGGTTGIFNVQNTIIAKNTASTAGPDANNPAGAFTDNGGNLIGVSGLGSGNSGFTNSTTQKGTVTMPLDPLLGPLQNNGGSTIGAPGTTLVLPTEGLTLPSPAHGKGLVAGAPTVDARSFPSIFLGKINVGAVAQLGVFAIGQDSSGSQVKIFDAAAGGLTFSFLAFDPAFTGGVSVAVGDVNGDGILDIIVGAGPSGGPHVKVIDGTKLNQLQANGEIADTALLGQFFAYNPQFLGGVNVAYAQTSTFLPEIVTGAGPGGGPHVKVIDGTKLNQLQGNGEIADTALLGQFFAYNPQFAGGVFVAAGDLNGDGTPDIVTGAGAGGGPHVKAVDGTKLAQLQVNGEIADSALLGQFYAYDPGFTGGVTVAVTINQAGTLPEIITGAGPGGGPHVKAIDATKLNQVQGNGEIANSALLGQFFAYDPTFLGGVTVAGQDVNGDGTPDIITGAGPGGGPHVKVVDGTMLANLQANGEIADAALLDQFFAFSAAFTGGASVGGRL